MRLASALAAIVLLLGATSARASDLDDGKKLLKEGRAAEAAVVLQRVLQASPGNREAMLLLAKAAAEGRLADASEEAERALHAALKVTPDDRTVRLALGSLYLSRVRDDPRWRADVQDQFGRLLRADPADEEAAVGMARNYYEGADPARGVEVLDALLAKKPTSAPALYWKGKILFDDATQQFQRENRLTEAAKAAFEGALAAFDASTKADGTQYDAWIHVGYSAQYLAGADRSRIDVATAAYTKALDVDGDDPAAMKGLAALHSGDAARWGAMLEKLAKERPKTPIVLYYHAYSLRQQGKKDLAEKEYRAYVATSRHPAAGWFALAELAEEKGDAKEALTLYRKSLEVDPRHGSAAKAVTALRKPIEPRLRDAVGDAAKAKAVVKDFAAIAALAPRDPYLRNDVAFFAREAYGNTKDRALLDAAIRYYEEAAALVGPFQADYEQTVPYRDRHGFAQIHNDAGLMFQYYPETKDLAKAEAHYKEALAWSQNGYWDTYGNLLKLYEAADRIKDAHELAVDCADGLKNPDGSSNETWRGTARGDAIRLEGKLPK
jgi:cytochrome c-type biogenesis protein CcmH/NrfG